MRPNAVDAPPRLRVPMGAGVMTTAQSLLGRVPTPGLRVPVLWGDIRHPACWERECECMTACASASAHLELGTDHMVGNWGYSNSTIYKFIILYKI